MSGFDPSVLAAAMREREVDLTTWGRKTGQPGRVTLWIWGDDHRLFIRSGGGLSRDWPRNLLAHGRGILHLGGRDLPVRARHVTDPAEARSGAGMIERKYGRSVPRSTGDEPLTPAEQATFELLPDDGPGYREGPSRAGESNAAGRLGQDPATGRLEGRGGSARESQS